MQKHATSSGKISWSLCAICATLMMVTVSFGFQFGILKPKRERTGLPEIVMHMEVNNHE